MIIGCDFHPSWQQIAWFDSETGETGEEKLVHAAGEAKQFYQQVAAPALIGMEATGNSQWFIELVEDLEGTRSGPETRRRSVPATCASRRRISGMLPIF
jgi:transposase